ncbi:MAG: extracellular solute-binding protein [Lachnospiraceae bacterium]|nr:extracellular solute-binding protein [Lachnospiraceae bacterium]
MVKKFSLRKVLTLGLVTALGMAALTGCGGAKGSSGSAAADDALKNSTYRMTEESPAGVQGQIGAMRVLSDKLYVVTSEYVDTTQYPADWEDGMPPADADPNAYYDLELTNEVTIRGYSMGLDGSGASEIFSMVRPEDETWNMDSAAIAPDGSFYLLKDTYNEETGMPEFEVLAIDANGQEAGRIPLKKCLPSGSSYVNSLCADDKGNLAFRSDNHVVVIDQSGKVKCDLQSDQFISELTYDKNGNFVSCIVGDDAKGMDFKTVDVEKGTYGTVVTIDKNGAYVCPGAGEYDFFFSGTEGIMGVREGVCVKVMDYTASGLTKMGASDFLVMADQSIVLSYMTSEIMDTRLTDLTFMTKVDPKELADLQTITFGGMYISDAIKKEGIAYNRSQNKYRITFVDYADREDPSAAFSADLLAGNVPDIIDMTYLPIKKYIAKGMLSDLYPFIDKDPDLNREDFFESVLKAMESDGKLYYASSEYLIQGIVGNSEVVGDVSALSMQDVNAIEQKTGTRLYAPTSTAASVLTWLTSGKYDDYIDYSTGKCSFDSQQFIDLLDYANTYPKEEPEDIAYDLELLVSGDVAFASMGAMNFEDVEYYEKVFDGKEVFTAAPPSKDGGLVISPNECMTIYAKSKNADGAWDFMRRFLMRDHYSKMLRVYISGMPLRKDCFEDAAKVVTATDKWTDSYGNKMTPISGSRGVGDYSMELGPLTESQVEKMKGLIGRVTTVHDPDEAIDGIISEEAGALFAGQKSAKDVAAIIQNRVSNYINENR